MDKSGGISSHGVVSLVRRALGTRSVGHAGTLDPMATGLLVLGVGQGTKLLNYLVADDKRYRATVRLGTVTDTLDAEGRVTATEAVPEGLTTNDVEQAAQGFVGRFEQRVPDVSAIKRDGEPLYRKVRRGEVVDAPSREVTLHAIDVLSFDGREIELAVHTGKGFYVRSLARDLGERLGTVAHLGVLRRLTSGVHDVQQALGLARVRAARDDEEAAGEVRAALLPLSQAVGFMRCATVDATGCADLSHGRVASAETVVGGSVEPGQGPIAFLSEQGALVAIGMCDDAGLHTKRGFPA